MKRLNRKKIAGDFHYLSTHEDGRNTKLQNTDFDYDTQLILCNILIDYGFQNSRSEYFSNTSNASNADDNRIILPNAIHTTVPRHNNHLHVHNYRLIPNIYE